MENTSLLALLIRAIDGDFLTVEELLPMLEITVEDIIERFPDRLVEHAAKFGLDEQEWKEWMDEEKEWREEEVVENEGAEETLEEGTTDEGDK